MQRQVPFLRLQLQNDTFAVNYECNMYDSAQTLGHEPRVGRRRVQSLVSGSAGVSDHDDGDCDGHVASV